MIFCNLLAAYTSKSDDGYLYAERWTAYAQDTLSQVFTYVAIALAVILLGVGVFVRLKKKESLGAYVKTAVTFAFGVCLAMGITMLALQFADMYEAGSTFALVLIPTAILCGVIVIGIAAVYAATFTSAKATKLTAIVSASVFGAALIALFVCLAVYYATGDAESNNYATITQNGNILLYICAAVLIGVIILGAFLLDNGKKGFDTKSISYAAVCIAMSFALSFLKPFTLPQGGSVTLASLLPLCIYSYMFGTKKGVLAGGIYGLLQAVQDPWIIHPAQFLLDYPVAFAAFGLVGAFAKIKKLDKLPQLKFALGAVCACMLRYASHLFSGVFAFASFAPEELNPWIYSLGYNSFVFVDIAVVIMAGVIVFSSKTFNRQIAKYTATPTPAEPNE